MTALPQRAELEVPHNLNWVAFEMSANSIAASLGAAGKSTGMGRFHVPGEIS